MVSDSHRASRYRFIFPGMRFQVGCSWGKSVLRNLRKDQIAFGKRFLNTFSTLTGEAFSWNWSSNRLLGIRCFPLFWAIADFWKWSRYIPLVLGRGLGFLIFTAEVFNLITKILVLNRMVLRSRFLRWFRLYIQWWISLIRLVKRELLWAILI